MAVLVAVAGTVGGAVGWGVAESQPVAAAPPGDDAIVAFVVRGVGNGHGRGLSQWGAYGRALAGQTWTQILDTYYSNTTLGDRPGAQIRVRLTRWNGSATVGVLSQGGTAAWSAGGGGGSSGHRALYAQEVAPNQFRVYGSANYVCPGAAVLVVPTQPLAPGATGQAVSQLQQVLAHLGHNPGPIDGIYGAQTTTAVKAFQGAVGLPPTGSWNQADWEAAQAKLGPTNPAGWTELTSAPVAGPIRFSSGVDDATAPRGSVLGVCTSTSIAKHYRGVIELTHRPANNYVVNDLPVDTYLRGVIPAEVPASWGDGGGGAGMHALRAQAVAARSYAISQNRYDDANTCDTPSCQVYEGADREDPRTDAAIADTAGKVRLWPDGRVVSTEFSASNGARTAGGSFPAVDDAQYDDQPGNPLHVWTRVIDADTMAATFNLSSAAGVRTEPNPASPWEGVWANRVVLEGSRTVDALGFRSAFGLPSHGFEIVPVTRQTTSITTFAYIGDSVGEGISGKSGDAGPLPALLEGVHARQYWNSRGGRPTGGGSDDGVAAAAGVPTGTDVAVVELGYNDTPSRMPERIDAVMQTLRNRGVRQVLWATVSERSGKTDYAPTNAAIRAAAERWPELSVIDWHAASAHPGATRWYSSDGVHLTTTGNAEFSLWLREHILDATARPLAANSVYRVPLLGLAGLPAGATAGAAGLAGVALNVTAVNPRSPGWLRVWDCAAPVEPDTSSVNYMTVGGVEPNAVVVPLAATSAEVCIRTKESTHVVVDVAGWFPADSGTEAGILQPAAGRLIDTRDPSIGALPAQGVLTVPVLGQVGVPADGVVGLALNVTAVEPAAAGWLRVWDCATPEPDTSSVNYLRPGVVEPNAVIVPLAPGSPGEVCVRTKSATHVIVDVAGWFSAGAESAAGRVIDTRQSAPAAAQSVLRVPVSGVAGVPETGVAGVALNVTATEAAAAGWLRVWDCAAPEPDTSSVNYLAGATEPNAVVVPFSDDSTGEVCVRTKERTHVIVDVAGWFSRGVAPAAGRIADTRYGLGPLPE